MTKLRVIKSAEEVIADTKRMRAKLTREKRQASKEQLELEFYEDLRDEVVGIALASGLTFEGIHERNGPHAQTLIKWADRLTRKPQLAKLRSTLRICGYDFAIVDRRPQLKLQNGNRP